MGPSPHRRPTLHSPLKLRSTAFAKGIIHQREQASGELNICRQLKSGETACMCAGTLIGKSIRDQEKLPAERAAVSKTVARWFASMRRSITVECGLIAAFLASVIKLNMTSIRPSTSGLTR